MTQKQKDLLLKDLCARLPHGVKVQCLSHQIPLKILSINPNGVTWLTGDKGYPFDVDWKDCKPYLFPLSSMTEEQQIDLTKYLKARVFVNSEISFQCLYANTMDRWKKVFDWCIKNHFDIYSLIPMDLANDATGLNIY